MTYQIINRSFQYVIETSKKYNIDESHSIKHAMDVLTKAKYIYRSELDNHPELINDYVIICVSAILHDMCDKKYMDETIGIYEMKMFMHEYIHSDELTVISKIIQTMSYSKVKLNGYPEMKQYQLAYNIVREADLLAAYDIDRCIIYGLMIEKYEYIDAVHRARTLFIERVLKYREDNLFTTKYAQDLSIELHAQAIKIISDQYTD